jgi:hypothetical protein
LKKLSLSHPYFMWRPMNGCRRLGRGWKDSVQCSVFRKRSVQMSVFRKGRFFGGHKFCTK